MWKINWNSVCSLLSLIMVWAVWHHFLSFQVPTYFPSSSSGPTLLYSLALTSFSQNVRLSLQSYHQPTTDNSQSQFILIHCLLCEYVLCVGNCILIWDQSLARLNSWKGHKSEHSESHLLRFPPKNCSADNGEQVCTLYSWILVCTNFLDTGWQYPSHRDSDIWSCKTRS